MGAATFDKSRNLQLYARIGETGVPIVLEFLNSDGTNHDITSYDFKLRVKARPFSTENFFELGIGTGLTVLGADNQKLSIALTSVQADTKPDTNFWYLYSENQDHTWLNGPFIFHNGEFDGLENASEIIVNENGTPITITIESLGEVVVNVDGGHPDSNYTNIEPIDGGTP